MLKKHATTTKGIGLIFLTVFSLFLSSTWGKDYSHQPANRALAEIITPQQSVITAEIADTPAKRSQGLMFRKNMPTDHGMLFIFRELDHWTFWMKNTKMPLDIIWLDKEGKVVHIESNVPICTRTDEGCPRYRTLKEALYVLELGAGLAKYYNMTIGSHLTIKLPK